jgi:hypothetical protein
MVHMRCNSVRLDVRNLWVLVGGYHPAMFGSVLLIFLAWLGLSSNGIVWVVGGCAAALVYMLLVFRLLRARVTRGDESVALGGLIGSIEIHTRDEVAEYLRLEAVSLGSKLYRLRCGGGVFGQPVVVRKREEWYEILGSVIQDDS